MRTTVPLETIGRLIEGRHENPFELLGPHEVEEAGRRALAVRAFLPESEQAWLVHQGHNGDARPMRRIHPAGLFEAICPMPENADHPPYQLRVADRGGRKTIMHDPYAFPQLLTGFDLHLLNEGRHWRLYERLGAQARGRNALQVSDPSPRSGVREGRPGRVRRRVPPANGVEGRRFASLPLARCRLDDGATRNELVGTAHLVL